MRSVGKLVLLLAILALLLGGCAFFGFLNPVWALEGTWVIVQKPAELWEPHTTFTILAGAEGYEFRDQNGQVFESGPVSNITRSSFDYTIAVHTGAPFLEGSDNYAEYTATPRELTVTFYDDSSKAAVFGTITCERE